MDGPQTDPDVASSRILKFGKFRLNETERRLLQDGRFIDIKPKTFEVLLFLVANSGKTVSKDEILDSVWEGNIVEEGNLAVHISRLRKIFETTGAGDLIKTISGSGYRFVEPVEEIDADEWKKCVEAAGPFLDPYEPDEEGESIAVMPLRNENGDVEIDYLADGLTEALINNLSCRPSLRVLARNTVFQFKNKEFDVRQVGRRLNVSHVLTGRIRLVNDIISLGVELTRVSDGIQIWGTQFNRDFEYIFDMQDNITNSICENLNAEIDRAASRYPNQKHTQNTESYRLYLKGKYLVSNRRSVSDVLKAEKLFQTSIGLDPSFAPAYVELANCLRVLYLYQQRMKDDTQKSMSDLLAKAFRINSSLPEYFMVKGYIEMFLNFNFSNAERCFVRAINLNPGSAVSHIYLGRLYVYLGRVAEGLREASESARLDPISHSGDKNLAKIFLMTSQFENAIFRLEECLELEPNDFETLVLMGFALTELERYDGAIECFRKALEIQDHIETVAMIGYTRGKSGNRKEALKSIALLEKASDVGYVPQSFFAVVYAGLGDPIKCIEHLELAEKEKYVDLVALKVDPRWNSVRHETRFSSLLKRIGLERSEPLRKKRSGSDWE